MKRSLISSAKARLGSARLDSVQCSAVGMAPDRLGSDRIATDRQSSRGVGLLFRGTGRGIVAKVAGSLLNMIATTFLLLLCLLLLVTVLLPRSTERDVDWIED